MSGKRTLLYDVERERGASFAPRFGWELPARFDGPAEEYRAARTAAGLIDLTYRGLLEVSGKDRTRFLNGMVTNDVRSLAPGQGLYAAFLTPRGKLIADARIYASADAYWIDLHEELAPKVRQVLERHLIADQVEIRDRSGECVALGVQGPASPELLARLGLEQAKDLKEHQHLEAAILGLPARLIRVSETGDDGFVILVPASAAPDLWRSLLQAWQREGVAPVGMGTLNILRIEAGIPWYGVDMDETTLLQEAGLEQAVSFSKGCYVGQETVARVAHRGHVNWHLLGLLVHGHDVPEAGARLYHQGRPAGRITSAVRSPALGRTVALAYVRRELKAPGTHLDIVGRDRTLDGEVVPLPFYRRR